MTVKELISVLTRCPEDFQVRAGYDNDLKSIHAIRVVDESEQTWKATDNLERWTPRPQLTKEVHLVVKDL